MPRTLKLVFHVEDEDKNLVMEKSQMLMRFEDDILDKAEYLSSMDDFPSSMGGLKAWQEANKPYADILEIIKAAYDVHLHRVIRKYIIDWAKKQRTPANAG